MSCTHPVPGETIILRDIEGTCKTFTLPDEKAPFVSNTRKRKSDDEAQEDDSKTAEKAAAKRAAGSSLRMGRYARIPVQKILELPFGASLRWVSNAGNADGEKSPKDGRDNDDDAEKMQKIVRKQFKTNRKLFKTA